MTDDKRAALWRYALATAVGVATLAVLVFTGATERFDQAAVTAATDVTRAYPGLREALVVLEELTRPVWLYAVATVVCVVAGWWARMPRRALAAWLTMMAIWGSAALLKLVVGRERPAVEDAVWDHGGLSFPSGHATNTTAMTLTLALLLWPVVGVLVRRLLVVGATLLVAVVVLDRVFLGVHYPSDVIAGVIFGGGLTLAGSRLWPSSEGRRGQSLA
ncbi:MAG: phosphatase PAP2 family protein [Dermatophilaceae bacterium]|nr:phosphatase PAP2 family protein [Intrasporangiaceae bacterium]